MEFLMNEETVTLGNWVPTLLALDPDMAPALVKAGIRDEASYVDREMALPRRIRTQVAISRRDLSVLDRIPLHDLALVSPPWMRGLSPAQIGVPGPIAEELEGVGVRCVADLARTPDALTGTSAIRAVRLALYRAGKAGAPRPAPASVAAQNRVSALVTGAPEGVRSAALEDIPDIPTRALNAARRSEIRTVGELIGWSDKDLKMLPYFGEGTLQGLIDSLECAIEAIGVSPEADPDEDREMEPCA
jgi:hypothetical protein